MLIMCISRLFQRIEKFSLNSIKSQLNQNTGKVNWSLSFFRNQLSITKTNPQQKSKLEINREKMKKKIQETKKEDCVNLDSSKLHQAVTEERKKCAPGGFGQS